MRPLLHSRGSPIDSIHICTQILSIGAGASESAFFSQAIVALIAFVIIFETNIALVLGGAVSARPAAVAADDGIVIKTVVRKTVLQNPSRAFEARVG